jgi:hypothetical protein
MRYAASNPHIPNRNTEALAEGFAFHELSLPLGQITSFVYMLLMLCEPEAGAEMEFVFPIQRTHLVYYSIDGAEGMNFRDRV